ncbi:unnamed protein product, partial [marine sediment metagenome]
MSRCGIFFLFAHYPGLRFAALGFVLCLFALAQPQAVSAQSLGEVVITNSYANIRSGPGTSYRNIGKVYRSERFPALEKRGKWYRITYKNQNAWVYGPLVRLEKVSAQEVDRLVEEIEVVDARIDRLQEKIDEANSQLARLLGQPESGETERDKKKGPSVGPKKDEGILLIPRVRKPIPVAWALIPGGPRLMAGDKLKGRALLGATAGSLALGIYC